MAVKVGTLIDEDLLNKARKLAVEKNTSLKSIFEMALAQYLAAQEPAAQISPVEVSFGTTPLPLNVVRQVTREDLYEVE